ncbi:hypothetical protein M413DRAFT_445916 [Hebeloma cylindrosporum]|uniref:C2H2-type domain-containing protein n=1 Tax=Hebeloma cylindrosporum TaxID=76867 RepID=A0A0C3C8A6_HEBCY|nr:hypothetical protein M413DRAFT_445916 [Hebeloma cylindrosporum h7]
MDSRRDNDDNIFITVDPVDDLDFQGWHHLHQGIYAPFTPPASASISLPFSSPSPDFLNARISGLSLENGSSSFSSPTLSTSSYLTGSSWGDVHVPTHNITNHNQNSPAPSSPSHHSNDSMELPQQLELGASAPSSPSFGYDNPWPSVEVLSPSALCASAPPSPSFHYHSNASVESLPLSALGASAPSSPFLGYDSNASAEWLPYSPLGASVPSSPSVAYHATGSVDVLPQSAQASDSFGFHPSVQEIFLSGPCAPEQIPPPSVFEPGNTANFPASAGFKTQVSSDAALAVSEKKRKKAPICDCPLCGQDFTRISSLKSHMDAHNGNLTKFCKFCGKYLAGTLSRHKRKCKKNPNRDPPNKRS